MTERDPDPKTADALRADIDRGMTGDKVAGSDPAAAPLGTDAEAAGTPPTPREIDLEARSRTVVPDAATPAPRRSNRRAIGAGVVIVILLVLVVAWAT